MITMPNNNVLETEDIPQVAMDAMNDVHRDELNIVNNVNAAIVANNNDEISRLCQQWIEHTKAHFERENYMMEKYDFPAFHCHHREHVEALQGLENIIELWKNTNNIEELAQYVQQTWPNWYVSHIGSMDIVTSGYIKQAMENE